MRRRVVRLALCGATLPWLIVTGSIRAEQRTDWRAVASADDRERLREWRDAWQEGLALARRAPGADVIAREPPLFDPDDALDRPMPVPGSYRCRTIKLGRADGGAALAIGGWGECRVGSAGALLRLERLDGGQRLAGLIYAGGSTRAVFLGTVALAEERRAIAYGHVAGRDMAGVVERIGERRWRLALPYPPFDSKLELLEFEPAA